MERGKVGRRLMIIRRSRMWTQVRLAEEAGVSPTTVSGIESGRANLLMKCATPSCTKDER